MTPNPTSSPEPTPTSEEPSTNATDDTSSQSQTETTSQNTSEPSASAEPSQPKVEEPLDTSTQSSIPESSQTNTSNTNTEEKTSSTETETNYVIVSLWVVLAVAIAVIIPVAFNLIVPANYPYQLPNDGDPGDGPDDDDDHPDGNEGGAGAVPVAPVVVQQPVPVQAEAQAMPVVAPEVLAEEARPEANPDDEHVRDEEAQNAGFQNEEEEEEEEPLTRLNDEGVRGNEYLRGVIEQITGDATVDLNDIAGQIMTMFTRDTIERIIRILRETPETIPLAEILARMLHPDRPADTRDHHGDRRGPPPGGDQPQGDGQATGGTPPHGDDARETEPPHNTGDAHEEEEEERESLPVGHYEEEYIDPNVYSVFNDIVIDDLSDWGNQSTNLDNSSITEDMLINDNEELIGNMTTKVPEYEENNRELREL